MLGIARQHETHQETTFAVTLCHSELESVSNTDQSLLFRQWLVVACS